MSERAIQNEVLLALADLGMTGWRQNVGTGWAGKAIKRADGSVLIQDARPLHAGLCKGSSDIIGLRPVIITDAMIGKTLAQFVALEIKQPGQSPTPEQRHFLAFVSERGGFARVVRSVGDLA
jgi:hypothetical protein